MNSKVKKNKNILYDPLIIPRVKQYLEENVHQTYVDVAVMARQLQDRYREYSRRKVGPFRMLVEQAYRTVLHSYGLDSNPSSEDNDGSDVEMMEGDGNNPSNHLNNALTDLYSKNTQSSQKTDSELIDISSDESGNEGEKQISARTGMIVVGKSADGSVTAFRNVAAKMPKNGARAYDSQSDNNNTVIASFGPQGATIHKTKKRKLDNNSPARAAGEKSPPTSGSGGGTGDGVSTTSNLPSNSAATRIKKYKKEVKAKRTTISFHDLGGLDRILKQLCELLFHMKHPEVYNHIGVDPPRGILLHGPPGCGKTLLAHAIAGQLDLPLIEVPATELIGGVSGESEERIRDIFDQAGGSAPCILFIDEIDAISSNRINAQKDMERRIVAQLMSSLDSLSKLENDKQVLVIGATNRPDVLDPALRRVGRFDHELCLGIPDRDEREEILIIICEGLCLETPMDFAAIAELTPGYVGADLQALTSRAASLAITRAFTKIYKKKQEVTKDITIVDLIDEAEAAKERGDKQAVPEIEAVPAEKNEEVTVIADNDADSVDPKEKPESSLDANAEDSVQMVEDTPAVADAAVEIQETSAEAEEAKPPEDEVIKLNGDEAGDCIAIDDDPTEDEQAEKEKEEVVESMDVAAVEEQTTATDENPQDLADSAAVNDESANEADGNEQTNEEKDAVPADEVMDAIDLDEMPEEEQPTNTQKNIAEISLFEMANWIEKDTQAIMGSQLDEICITLDDFKNAIKLIVPSAKREGFITVPDVTWDDIGSLRDIREELQLAVVAPVKFPAKMKALGLSTPSGVLLCGPPGCGKTLLAKAIANEAGINFISVKGPELMNMYVGESERAVRQCFQRARNSQPCVIFFDEFDSLCPKRSDAADGGSSTRVVNQLLTEMDGIDDRKGVFLMAASNRPDIIDPAVLRPGRLDKVLYVGLPGKDDRVAIIEALTKKRTVPVLAEDVDIDIIAIKTEGYTGADLAGLIRQASLLKLKESISGEEGEQALAVHEKHFLDALNLTKPSVSAEDKKVYERLRLKYAAPRTSQPSA